MDEILSSIRSSVESFLQSDQNSSDLDQLKFDPHDLLLINNSFIKREKTSIRTTKNDKYLAVPITEGRLLANSPLVVSGIQINSDWKRLPQSAREKLEESTIERAVEDELSRLGRLLFIIIGKVDDSIVLRQEVSSSHFSEIVWDPKWPSAIDVQDETITIRNATDELAIWDAVQKVYKEQGKEMPANLQKALAKALDELKDNAVANLVLPNGVGSLRESMIDSILEVLRLQRDEYRGYVQKGDQDGEVANDVLRIAYNFATDALIFIRLLVSICDLKPIVLWGTFAEHSQLAQALKNLPLHTQSAKPSLRDYHRAIADARNSAFHNLFPFRKSLRVNLPEEALQNASLQIFSEHGRKKENELLYQDKELVDLLFEFTRARERNVSMSFWRRNLHVMDATIQLCEATSSYLKLLCATVGE